MSSEHQREAPPRVDSGGGAASGTKPYQRLPSLITLAFEEPDRDAQRRHTTTVIDLLIAMRAPGDEPEEARLLVAHLEAKTLTALVDEKGRRAHTEAVETLLSLGFPHALNVTPEDLKRFRDDQGSIGSELLTVPRQHLNASNLVLAAQGASIAYATFASGEPFAWAIMAAFAGIIGALQLRVTRARESKALATLAVGAATVVGLTGGFASVDGVPLLLLSAATGTGLIVMHREPSKPD